VNLEENMKEASVWISVVFLYRLHAEYNGWVNYRREENDNIIIPTKSMDIQRTWVEFINKRFGECI